MLGSATFFFLAFSKLPLAEGYLVFFTSPFLVMALSAVALREAPPRAAWAWCGVGFAGVMVGLAPSLFGGGAHGGPWLGYVYAFAGTVCYSLVFVLNRSLRSEPGMARVLVWPALLGLVAMLPLGLAEWRAPSAFALAVMVANGVIVALATVFLAEAFRHATASRLAPFGYSGLVWSVGYDLGLFGHTPGLATLAGAALVVTACVMSERAAAQGMPAGKS